MSEFGFLSKPNSPATDFNTPCSGGWPASRPSKLTTGGNETPHLPGSVQELRLKGRGDLSTRDPARP
eukprot:scaffold226688_cov44-Prasinocladus_malaysianus.AAC.2